MRSRSRGRDVRRRVSVQAQARREDSAPRQLETTPSTMPSSAQSVYQKCRKCIDLFLVIRLLGIMGMIWVIAKLLYVSLVVAPAKGLHFGDILSGQVGPGNQTEAMTQEELAMGRYCYYLIFIGFSNLSTVAASIIKRPSPILLWMSFEFVTLLWHYYFFLTDSPPEFSTTFMDAISTMANIVTAGYIYYNLHSLVDDN